MTGLLEGRGERDLSRACRSCRAAGRGAEGRDTAREQRHSSRIGRLALERSEASTPGGQMTGRQGGERTEGEVRCGAPPGEFVPSQRASTLAGLPRSRAVDGQAVLTPGSDPTSVSSDGRGRGRRLSRVDYDYCVGRRGGEEASEREKKGDNLATGAGARGKLERVRARSRMRVRVRHGGPVCRRRWDGRERRAGEREHSTSTQGHPPGSGGCCGEWCGPVGGCGAVVFSRLEPGCAGGRRTARDGSTTRVRQGSVKGQDRALGDQGWAGYRSTWKGTLILFLLITVSSDIVP